jgi:hypothetical protein
MRSKIYPLQLCGIITAKECELNRKKLNINKTATTANRSILSSSTLIKLTYNNAFPQKKQTPFHFT